MSLTGKVVVVTGASAGVGRATARRFARQGASVALIARGSEGLDAALSEVQAEGVPALAIEADVSDAKQVQGAGDRVEAELGPLDIWVNNAMVSVFMPLEDIDPEDFKRVTEVTYLGYVYGTMTALSKMRPRGRGHIVQVGSALAYRGIPLQSAYCGAKHAIQGFTESVRCELLHDKVPIRISSVQLPAVNTPQFHWVKTNFDRHPQPVPPIFQPEVAADAIVWTAQSKRSEVYVGGPTVKAIMGNRVAPRLLDHYLARTGVDSQKANRPIEPNRSHNLYEPLRQDMGARGEFDARSKSKSYQLWLTKRRRSLGIAGLVVGGLLTVSAALTGDRE